MIHSGVVELLIAGACWGATAVFVKLLPRFSSTILLGARLTSALVLLLVGLLIPKMRKNISAVDLRRKETWILSLFMLIYYFSAITAFQRAPAGNAALLIGTTPLFSLLLKLLSGGKPRKQEALGAFLTFLGLFLFLFARGGIAGDTRINEFTGYGFALVSALMTALSASLSKQWKQNGLNPKPFSLSLSACLAGVPILIFGLSQGLNFEVTVRELWIMAAFGFVATLIPTLAFFEASQKLPPVTTGTVSIMIPLWTYLFSSLWLGEIPMLQTVPGIGVILVGLVLILRGQSNKTQLDASSV